MSTELTILLFCLLVEGLFSFIYFHWFPILGFVVSETILFVNKCPWKWNMFRELTRKMRIRKKFKFRGWFYSISPYCKYGTITSCVLSDMHGVELYHYIIKKRKEGTYDTIKVKELDFLSERCMEILSLIYFITDGKDGVKFYPATKALIDKYSKI